MGGEVLAALVAAFAVGVAFALGVCVLGYLLVTYRQDRLLNRRGQALQGGGDESAGKSKAWPDLEQGECTKSNLESEKASGAAPLTPRQLCETLRGLLEDEISKGLRSAGLAERLQRLEKEVWCKTNSSEYLREELKEGSENKLRSCAMTRTPNSSDRSGGSSAPTEDLALPGAIVGLPLTAPGPAPPAVEFGPTDRQRQAAEPPENNRPVFKSDKESALHSSLVTVQRALGNRDAQTTELHRQLKESRQCLWLQTSQAREATAKLQAILTDPSRAPQAQAEMLKELREEVKSLSSRLAEAQEQEKMWSAIAKRQRAFFLQNERMSQEWLSLIRKHPAGEIFLVPPPVALDDDDANPPAGRWDVGTSHCNPYKVDSWPFEPNVLAARASREPDLNRWDEGLEDEEEDEEDEDSDEVHIPNMSDDEDEDLCSSDQGEDGMQQGAGGHARMPQLPPGPGFGGSETARSL